MFLNRRRQPARQRGATRSADAVGELARRILGRDDFLQARRRADDHLEHDRPVLVHKHAVIEMALNGSSENETLDVPTDPLEIVGVVPCDDADDVLLDDRSVVQLLRKAIRRNARISTMGSQLAWGCPSRWISGLSKEGAAFRIGGVLIGHDDVRAGPEREA